MNENNIEGTKVDKSIVEIAYTLKTLRKANKITQQELSVKTGVARSNIAKMETGKLQPSLHMIIKLCEALGCTLSITFDIKSIQETSKIKDGTISRELFAG